jgi:hypothetical protein
MISAPQFSLFLTPEDAKIRQIPRTWPASVRQSSLRKDGRERRSRYAGGGAAVHSSVVAKE